MYWWAGLLVCILFISINVLVFLLRNKPQISYAIVYSIALFLLVWKTLEYIHWQAIGEHWKFPVEFSALSYFLLGISVVFRIKKMEQFSALVALLSGMMFSITFWISPNSFIQSMDAPIWFSMSILNHHLLYFASTLLLFNIRKFSIKDCWIPFLGVGIMVAYSWIVYIFTPYAALYGKPTIIQICDGSILSWLGANAPTWALILYWVLATALLIGIILGFYALNKLAIKRRTKVGLMQEWYPKKWKEIYAFKISNKDV